MNASLALLCAVLSGFLLCGCETDLPPERSDVPTKLQRGVTGQGTLYQQDQENDPMIRDSRVGH